MASSGRLGHPRPEQIGCSAQVAAMVPVLEKDLRDRKKTAEISVSPLAAASYHSLITGMLAQRLKQAPTAYYADPPVSLADKAPGAQLVDWCQ